jgi:hypothetical protein
MFLIAGVQPKTRVLDQNPRRCPRCGLQRAYLKRVDHYASLFFIPILRVKKGDPLVICEHCEADIGFGGAGTPPEVCRFCGMQMAAEFNYCPYCGRKR